MIAAAHHSMMGARAKAPAAKDYVQTGLLALWDGIENDGFNTHSYTSSTWKDLKGFCDLSCRSVGNKWEDDCFHFDKTYAFYNGTAQLSAACSSGWTAECVYSLDTAMGNYLGLFGNKWNYYDGSNVPDLHCIYGLNYYTGYNGYSCGNGGDPEIFLARSILGFSALTSLNTKISMTLICAPDYAELWANGVRIAQKSTTFKINTSIPGYMLGRSYAYGAIGGTRYEEPDRSSSTRTFDGKIYNHRIYSRALTASEIAANYAIDKARFGLT